MVDEGRSPLDCQGVALASRITDEAGAAADPVEPPVASRARRGER